MRGLVRGLWAWLLLLPGSALLGQAWDRWWLLPVLAASAGIALLTVVGAVRAGVSRWAAGTGTLLLLVLVGYLLTAGTGGGFGDTVRDALPRLLTAARPVPATADLIAPAVLLVGIAGIAAGAAMTAPERPRGHDRPTPGLAPVVAGVLVYLAGALLTAGSGDRWGVLALVLVALALGGWLLLDPASADPRGGLLAALPLALVALAVVAASAVPARDGALDPRDHVAPPVDAVATVHPLPQLAAWAADPDRELLRVRGDAYPLRLATLTSYDGRGWQPGVRFRPLRGGEKRGLPPGERRADVTAEVELAALDGPWLPVPGEPVEISETAAFVDPDTGTAVLPGRAEHGVRYVVRGRVDAPDADTVATSGVADPAEPGVATLLEVPRLPESLAAYARAATRHAATPFDQALALEAAVRGGRTVDPDAVGGSAYWRLETFLLGEEGRPGAQTGTAEQFASAFAVLARATGLPSRVVVGFGPGTDLGDGTRSVRGEDAFAWPEVYFPGPGWVAFSPTPDSGRFHDLGGDRGPVESGTGGRDPVQAAPSPSPDPTPPPPAPDRPDAAGPTDGEADPTATRAWLLPVAAVVLLGPLGVVLVLRARRRRRHRARGRIGAWAEVRDACAWAGLTRYAGEAATDFAARAERTAGLTGLSAIAAAAEAEAYRPDPTPTPAHADRAVVRRVVAQVRGLRPWWARWTWPLSPRPLMPGRPTDPRTVAATPRSRTRRTPPRGSTPAARRG